MMIGMTLGEFARAVDRSRSVVLEWEADRSRPLRSSWARIRRVLGPIEGELPVDYGRRLRRVRESLQLTRGEFGGRLGLSEKTIENLERQKNQPSRATTAKLLAVLASSRGARSPRDSARPRLRAATPQPPVS